MLYKHHQLPHHSGFCVPSLSPYLLLVAPYKIHTVKFLAVQSIAPLASFQLYFQLAAILIYIIIYKRLFITMQFSTFYSVINNLLFALT